MRLSGHFIKHDVPNVVRVLTVEEHEGETVLVMEYCAGGSLESRLKKDGALPVDEAVRVALEILEALAAVHKKTGVVHRDIKPSNILFTADGRARLGDFGLAQTRESKGRSDGTAEGHPGTPGYMAPEQERTRGRLNRRSDLYAMGCLLFEMLTWELYQDCRPGTKASSLNADVPAWLDDVLAKALDEDVWSRYETAEEMTAVLTVTRTSAWTMVKQGYNEKPPAKVRPKELPPDPEQARLHYERGVSHHKNGEFDHAIADLSKAIELDPKNARAYCDRGLCYFVKGELDRAIAEYTKAIELDPKNALAYHQRGVCYCSRGEYDRAIAELSKGIELDPKCAGAYYQRGACYRCKGEYDRAIADLSKAIEMEWKHAWAYLERGVCYRSRGEYDRAIAEYTKAIELDPKNARAYYEGGDCYLSMGEYDRAIAE
jgi:tetratricopeptide (TPR) repeat protein